MGAAIPPIGVLLEQTLGHVSHGRNLQAAWARTDRADVRCRELAFPPSSLLDRVPPRSNWTVRSGLAARAAVRDLESARSLSALFVHTHVPAAFLGSTMRRLPTVVSIDATPRQIDTLGESYRHRVHSTRVEALKDRIHRRIFHDAASLVTWSQWAADSLVNDYGASADRIEVIPPGVVGAVWQRATPRPVRRDELVTRVLFVGGDFERKGGALLLDAVDHLNQEYASTARRRIEVHLVTSADIEPGPNVKVHHGLTPSHPDLVALYHDCDIFALPTLGDCSPIVLAEAATAGLPVITTDIGAIHETVLDGITGHLVEPNEASVSRALRRLVEDPEHRRELGDAATKHASRTMDAEANAERVLERLIRHARPTSTSGSVWLTVSGEVAPGIRPEIESGARPVADYIAIADATGARIVDRNDVGSKGAVGTKALTRALGPNIAMAHHLFRNRADIEVAITDGEQVGLPLAAMLRFGGRRGMRHLMIGHRLSPAKKAVPIRLLGLGRGVDEILVYSSSQLDEARELFRRPGQRMSRTDFMVDTEFFRPTPRRRDGAARARLCSAGREFRDYPTLVEAVRDLEVDVVIASASPWSRRGDNAQRDDVPDHVTVASYTQAELRDQLQAADLAVVPLLPSDFQAGITTILEAMAMELPVICTATLGQNDVVVEGSTGLYVPPGDVAALDAAIRSILADPEKSAEMGRRGRELVEARAEVHGYAERIAESVRWHLEVARVRAPDSGARR